jgi:hypothetical protein
MPTAAGKAHLFLIIMVLLPCSLRHLTADENCYELLRAAVGKSSNNIATNSYTMEISEFLPGKFKLAFHHAYGPTIIEGELKAAHPAELKKIAEATELVPIGSTDLYLNDPNSSYFHVILTNGSSVWHFEQNNRLQSYPFTPTPVVLEAVERNDYKFYQLHIFNRRHPESYKVFIFSGLHDLTDQAHSTQK